MCVFSFFSQGLLCFLCPVWVRLIRSRKHESWFSLGSLGWLPLPEFPLKDPRSTVTPLDSKLQQSHCWHTHSSCHIRLAEVTQLTVASAIPHKTAATTTTETTRTTTVGAAADGGDCEEEDRDDGNHDGGGAGERDHQDVQVDEEHIIWGPK